MKTARLNALVASAMILVASQSVHAAWYTTRTYTAPTTTTTSTYVAPAPAPAPAPTVSVTSTTATIVSAIDPNAIKTVCGLGVGNYAGYSITFLTSYYDPGHYYIVRTPMTALQFIYGGSAQLNTLMEQAKTNLRAAGYIVLAGSLSACGY